MGRVRHDYFTYYSAPAYERGIAVRGLLMFRSEPSEAGGRRGRRIVRGR